MAWVPAVEVALALVVVYGVLPRVLFRPPKHATGVLDRLLIDVVRMTALMIAVVHVLVPLRLFQWTGLLLFAAIWVYVVRLRPAGWGYRRFVGVFEECGRVVLYLIEAGSTQGNLKVKAAVQRWLRMHVADRLRPRIEGRTVLAALALAPLVVVLGISLAVRLQHPLAHASLAASDGYVHLTWTKEILAGNLFADGIYPRGMHAVLAVISTVMPPSAFDLLRFGGPMFNTFLVFVLFALALRATRNYAVSVLAATAAGLLTLPRDIGGFLSTSLRQVATLPQEFALLFALLGLWMVAYAIARPTRGRFGYVGLAAFAVAMTHPLGSGLVAVGAAAGAVAAVVATRRLLPAIRLGFATFAGTALGLAYVPFALWGSRRYEAVNRVNPLSGGEPTRSVDSLLAASGLLKLALVGFVIGVVYGVWLSIRRDRRGPVTLCASVFGLSAVAIQVTGNVFLHGWYHQRWTDLILPMLALGLALGLAPLRALWALAPRPGRIAAATATGAVLAVGLIVVKPPAAPALDTFQIEYEESARVVGTIIRTNERRTFTVVGPPTVYNKVLGTGFHVHLIDMIDRIRAEDAMDPSYFLPIPTERVYVLIEKEAYPYEDKWRTGGVLARYFDVEARQRMMDELDRWIRTYDRYHVGTSISFENERLRVWQIDHLPQVEYAKRLPLEQRRIA